MRWWATLRRDEGGAAAIELALIAPILGVVLLLMVDVGLAVNSRMAIDHIMRVGAETAMADPGESTVKKVVEQAAGQNFSPVSDISSSPTAGTAGVEIAASRFCACPQSRAVAVACTASCSGQSPLAFYRLQARKTYSGLLVSRIPMNVAIQVQVR